MDLAGGPAATAGLLSALVVARAPAASMATASAAVLGLYDDLAGHTHARGLRGHAAALRRGVVTSGIVKMGGLVVAAVVFGPARRRRPLGLLADVVLVAGSANLVNLLDLRPGRAMKVALAVSAPMTVTDGTASDIAAAVAGVSLALLPSDLGERIMLGDCGANALGATVGWALADRLSGGQRWLAAAAVTGLTIASERVSFTQVIENQPILSAIDRWGRRTA